MTRIGIAVAGDLVSAVITRRGKIGWTLATLIREDDVGGAVRDVLGKAPKRRWPRPRVWLSIDDPRSQPKIVRGLPPTADAHTLASVVAATPLRFFVSANGALVTTGVQVIEAGVIRAAAFPTCLLDAVRDACDSTNCRLAGVIPGETARATLTDDERDHTFAAAIGATRVTRREALAHRPRRHSAVPGNKRLLLAVCALTLLVGLAWALVPSIIAMKNARSAHQEVVTIARPRAKALAARRDFDQVTRSLSVVGNFEAGRLSMTMLLARLSDALPPASAITTLKADSLGITLVALAPRAVDVVQGIAGMPGIVHTELVGPVTRELVTAATNVATLATPPNSQPTTELQRVTVHFRLTSDVGSARRALAAALDDPNETSRADP